MQGRLYVVPTGLLRNWQVLCFKVKKGLSHFEKFGSSTGAHCCQCNRVLDYHISYEIGIESCIPLQGLDHVMFVAATGNRLLLRQYAIAFKKSGAQVPRTELAEIGPRIDFSIRRSRGAPDEIQTQSMKQPKLDKKKVSHHRQVAGVGLHKLQLNAQAVTDCTGFSCTTVGQ